MLLEKALGEPGHDAVVEVVAAQIGVAGGGEDLEDVLADLQDGDVERAAAEVVDGDLLRDVLSESIRKRGGGRLVEDAEHVQPGDPAGVLGGLPLVVVEVGGDGDDRLLDLVPEVVLDDRLHLLEHQRGDLGKRVDVLPDLDAYGVVLAFDDLVRHHRLRLLHLVREVEAADQALGAVHGVVGVGDDVALRAVADQHRAVLEEADYARMRTLAPFVREHGGFAVLQDGDAAVAGPQIDSYRDVTRIGHVAASLPWGWERSKIDNWRATEGCATIPQDPHCGQGGQFVWPSSSPFISLTRAFWDVFSAGSRAGSRSETRSAPPAWASSRATICCCASVPWAARPRFPRSWPKAWRARRP